MQGSVLTVYGLDNVIICHFVLDIILLLACSVWRCALPSITKLIHQNSNDPSKKTSFSALAVPMHCAVPILVIDGVRELLRDPENNLEQMDRIC
jgi:hypothetical protein